MTAPAASRPPILEGTTPGPWRAICIGRVWHVSDTGENFPIVTTAIENREANARLIAAAPDLAREVERLRAELVSSKSREWPSSHDVLIKRNQDLAREVERLRGKLANLSRHLDECEHGEECAAHYCDPEDEYKVDHEKCDCGLTDMRAEAKARGKG